jgi:flagellar basal-body rod protein FlgB
MGMNFEEEMKKAMAGVDSGAPPDSIAVLPEGELVARPDGNNVSMDREGLTMAEAQLRFKTGVSLLHEEYQKVLNAIHAQDK